MRAIDLGFIALTDAAALIVAREHGFFEAEALRVTLRREVSWATIRDKVRAGLYEGAHMLAPAVLAANLDFGADAASLIAPLSLNAHGATIGVSQALAAEMGAPETLRDVALAARALAGVVAARRAQGRPAPSFAVVFPFSLHNYMVRIWAGVAGLDPDRDLRIVVAPPTAIASRLRAGEIDGFSVGAPWGALCERESGAKIVLEASAFWPGGPDKVLSLSAAWAKREPEAALALTRAVLRAAIWAEAPENAEALARLLARPAYVGAPADLIARRLGADAPGAMRFASAAYPWPAHARWIAEQMVRWRQIAPDADLRPALDAYRPDIFERAAGEIGFALPTAHESTAAESGPLLKTP